MLKSILRRAVAALGIPLLLGAVPAQSRAPQLARPALWEVTNQDTTIYLFGTIHLLPDDLQWRTPTFDRAVSSSQQLVVETIVDQQNLQPLQAAEFSLGIRQGLPPIAQRVPAAQLPKLRAAIANSGVPEKFFNQMKTWLAAVQLLGVQFRALGLKGSHGPEEILRQQFISAHRPIEQLETNIEQFSYFDRLPENAQRELLEGSIEPSSAMDKEYGGMLSSWSRGDVKGIALTFNRDLSGSPELRQSLLLQRNANWARWIERRMTQPGTIMVAVGAGHLAGRNSVLATLKKDGYAVRRLQ
ncbi:MAG TPA: TraB/GumN family protein [Sphingomicrobium sp.]